ncbi:acyltransferase [Sphingomonas sp. VNH70]|uniref:acyltransferase family protein n=1 Tax=Sphingomonas silueang TaxID=3156617 RepID=UPI0032B41D8E
MKKFVAIESLRGWMAWWVVLGHAIHLSGTGALFAGYPLKLLPAGGLAVNVFMVVSGFVIAHLLLGAREGYGPYLLRRGWRLLPLMVVMLALAALVRPLYALAFIDNPFAAERAAAALRFQSEAAAWPAHLIAHLTMLHGALPGEILRYANLSFLAPAWSISLEWQFYIVAPLLLLLLTRRSAGAIAATLAILALTPLAFSGAIGHWQVDSFLPLMTPFFLIGMTLRLVFGARHAGEPLPWQAMLVSGIGLLVYAVARRDDPPLVILQCLTLAVAGGLFFLIAAVEVEVVRIRSPLFARLAWAVAHNPAAVAVGRVSYSTYLCHIPVFAIVVGGRIALDPDLGQRALVGWTAIAMAATLPASFLCYRYVEAPALAWGRTLFRPRRVVAPRDDLPLPAEPAGDGGR